jgi:hypothetical protein
LRPIGCQAQRQGERKNAAAAILGGTLMQLFATAVPARRFGSWPGLTAAAALAALIAACSGSTGSPGPQGAQGPQGQQGNPGTSGNPGAAPALVIGTASSITGTILGVSINSAPKITFTLKDQNGTLLSGLPLSPLPAYDSTKRVGIRFAIARLVAGTNGSASQWVNYYTRTVSSGTCPIAQCAGSPVTQATLDSTGSLTYDPATGIYTYTFSKDITTDPNYDKTATHRVAFQINGYAPANNGAAGTAATFRPDGGTIQVTRDIVDTSTCNNCHTKLAAHGGARVETQYCVMCHSPQSTDYFSGNTVDFKVMIHKIHTGQNLPSLAGVTALDPPVLGKGYWINTSNFNTVIFPFSNDTRYCSNCHVTSLKSAPDADNYEAVPTIEACGSCHDTINFATGAGHSTNIVADNTQCTTCHGVTSNINNGTLRVAPAHVPPADTKAAAFQSVINSVTFFTDAGGLKYPVVNFAIVDPTNANKPYNILADAPFVATDPGNSKPVCSPGGPARLALDIGWDTSDYTNWGSDPTGPKAATWGQPVSLNPIIPGATTGVPASCGASTLAYGGAVTLPATPAPGTLYGPDPTAGATLGSFWVVGPALPTPPAAPTTCAGGNACAPVQNAVAVLEGHPAVILTNLAGAPVNLTGQPVAAGAAQSQRISVKSPISYGNTAGTAAVARRQIVDIAKCDVCHKALTLHGNNRTNDTQVCVVCHNPASTDVSLRQGLTSPGIDGLYERPIDFKYMIHGIHGNNYFANVLNDPFPNPFVVYGFVGPSDFTDAVLPAGADPGNCNLCHKGTTYYPGDALSQAMTTLTGLSKDPAIPTTAGNPIATTPTMAACTGCHQDPLAISHMQQNGGSKAVTKDAEGRWTPGSGAAAETCAICHGAGALADVATVHNLAP